MKNLKKIIINFEKFFLKKTAKLNKNKNGIIFLLFHSVFKDFKDINYNYIHSRYGFTIDEYRYIFEEFLNAGYIFISHEDLKNSEKLNNQKKYIYLHFDDGYFNNYYILPLLKEYNIPSQFFVVTENIINNEKFWWDTIFYESKKKNNINYYNEINYLVNFELNEIRKYIKNKYGLNALIPKSDIDRPFTEMELKDFSSNNYVTIGNHTFDHTNLNILNNKKIEENIINAEKKIEILTGYSHKIFSFPNSNRNKIHTEILKNLNFNYALSEKFQNYKLNQINSNKLLELGRYCFVREENIEWQIRICNSRFSLYFFLSKLFK